MIGASADLLVFFLRFLRFRIGGGIAPALETANLGERAAMELSHGQVFEIPLGRVSLTQLVEAKAVDALSAGPNGAGGRTTRVDHQVALLGGIRQRRHA